jgi:hypothetical protein
MHRQAAFISLLHRVCTATPATAKKKAEGKKRDRISLHQNTFFILFLCSSKIREQFFLPPHRSLPVCLTDRSLLCSSTSILVHPGFFSSSSSGVFVLCFVDCRLLLLVLAVKSQCSAKAWITVFLALDTRYT